jgi:triosephosphate isomerase
MLSAYFGGKIVFTKKTSIKNKKSVRKEVFPKVAFAGQDISIHEGGSKTGEIPVKAVKDTGATKVIIGHSECRERGDTLEMIITKVKLALDAKLEVVLCIGEKERDASVAYLKVIDEQITSVFNAIDKSLHSQITLAYEPVWAIGTQITPTIEQITEVAELIKTKYQSIVAKTMQLVYGGSVNSENCKDIINIKDISGILVGGASLNKDKLFKILNS